MDYRYKLRENDEEGKSSRLTIDHDVTIITPDTEAAVAALKNIDNYGIYISNMRNKSSVEKAIETHFGNMDTDGKKIAPAKKMSIEKQRGEKFPIKTKQAIDDFVKSLTSTPTLLSYDVKGDKIVFPKDKNPSIETTKKIIKTVMNTAKVDFTYEGDKPSKKSTKESKEKELRLLIREEIRSLLNENEENSSITIEGISATGTGYTVWEGNKPIGDLRQKIGSYPKNNFGEINVGGNTFDFYYVTQIKTDKLPYIKSLKDHVGRSAYFTVSAPKDSGVSKEKLKAVAEDILEKNKNQDGITKLK
jgi:hypothetical protein